MAMETVNKKNWKSLKHVFCANQMWCEKVNTNGLNYGIWQVEYTRIKWIPLDFCLISSKSQKHFKYIINSFIY